MSLKRILQNQYQIMPWKNGQGITSQIQIFPEKAEFPGESFLWRFSSAKVAASGPFSLFPGCDRLLMVLDGKGVLLNETKLEPLKPLHFSGEFQVQCELLGDEIADIGLIYRRHKIKAEMNVVEAIVLDKSTTHLIYCTSGSVSVNGLRIESGDSLRIEGEKEVTLEQHSAKKAKLVHIKISHK